MPVTVRFCTLAGMLADLLRRDSLPALEQRLWRYLSPKLLICDEIGYLPCDSRSADRLYTIVSRRHENKSIVITTNLSFRQWGTVFPGAACVAALVDRFVQHCHVLDIDAGRARRRSRMAVSQGCGEQHVVRSHSQMRDGKQPVLTEKPRDLRWSAGDGVGMIRSVRAQPLVNCRDVQASSRWYQRLLERRRPRRDRVRTTLGSETPHQQVGLGRS
jgi:hypothetical protein